MKTFIVKNPELPEMNPELPEMIDKQIEEMRKAVEAAHRENLRQFIIL